MKLLLLFLAPCLLVCLHFSNTYVVASEISGCDFWDTVNITGSQKFNNGSYRYEGIIITPDLIGTYDYDFVNGTERIRVQEHLRGCACKIRPCVKFCCHPSEMKIEESFECTKMNDTLEYEYLINITLKDGSVKTMHLIDDFVLQKGIPCYDAYSLEADDWSLYENGTLRRLFDNAFLSKSEYCLAPSNGSVFYPMNCGISNREETNVWLNRIALLISIPFLVVTILVYLALPKLRNLHGKCLISYLVTITLSYIVMSTIQHELILGSYSLTMCSFLGFSAYFLFMSAFLWLSVISFDLWYHFKIGQGNAQNFLQRKRFCLYSTYVWSIASVMTALTYYAENTNWDPELKPGIGEIDQCWLNTDLWAPTIYFYGPVLILMTFNLIMYIFTAQKIYKVQRDIDRVMEKEENTKHLAKHKDNFGLFLRLFIVMGVPWILEVFAYLVGKHRIWKWFFYITDFCNAALGIVIFVIFVLRRKVWKLIKRRFSRKNSTDSDHSEDAISLQETEKITGLAYYD